jgi:hypothetical protein
MYDGFYAKNFFGIKTLIWIRIRIGPGFSNSLDPDPDSKQCLYKRLNCTFLYTVHCGKALLEENPAKHPIIILKDVPFLHLTAILEFMYAGEVNVAQGCVASSSLSIMDSLIYLVNCSFSDITGIHSSVSDPGSGLDPDSIRSVDPYPLTRFRVKNYQMLGSVTKKSRAFKCRQSQH